MKTQLFPTQIVDKTKMAYGEDIPNFSEPGTGKTISAIAAIEEAEHQTGIVCCPVIASPMWQENLERELGASCQIIKDKATPPARGVDFHIITYGLVTAHFDDLMCIEPDVLINDESQYLKSITADRTRAIFGEAGDGVGGLYSTCRQCWNLTGTPIERYSDDLWSQLRATQPEALERYSALTLDQFQRQFCRMEWKEYAGGASKKWSSVGNQNEKLLSRMLYDRIGIIRRTMDEVEGFMPPVTFREVDVRAKVDRELKDLLVGLDEHEIMELLLQGGDRVNQAYRLTGIAKIKDTVAYIKSIARHRKVLVGFWHHDVGKPIYEQLGKAKFAANYLDGATSMEARYRIKDRFLSDEIDIIVGQIQSMGNALDGLQGAANHVIFAEDNWAPSKIEQFWKRVWRLGQKRHVQVDFCRAYTIPVDTALQKLRERKAKGSALILQFP